MKKYFLLFMELLLFVPVVAQMQTHQLLEIKVHQICSQYTASLVYIIKLL